MQAFPALVCLARHWEGLRCIPRLPVLSTESSASLTQPLQSVVASEGFLANKRSWGPSCSDQTEAFSRVAVRPAQSATAAPCSCKRCSWPGGGDCCCRCTRRGPRRRTHPRSCRTPHWTSPEPCEWACPQGCGSSLRRACKTQDLPISRGCICQAVVEGRTLRYSGCHSKRPHPQPGNWSLSHLSTSTYRLLWQPNKLSCCHSNCFLHLQHQINRWLMFAHCCCMPFCRPH